MQYGLYTPNFDYFGDARVLAELAHDAEEAGWDGFFIWDHVNLIKRAAHVDPWVALAAMAMRTQRIHLGPMVTPISRRRPWKLARETVSVDRLSEGRLILGVGSGAGEDEFDFFGEATDAKVRAQMLDEGLDVLTRLWSGEPFRHQGAHYRANVAGFTPAAREPRIPIWVAATWPAKKPLRRAAHWDGVFPIGKEAMNGVAITPTEMRDLIEFIGEHRTSSEPFAVAHWGMTQGPDDTEQVQAYAEAGVTWWLESIVHWVTPLEGARERIRKGPPTKI